MSSRRMDVATVLAPNTSRHRPKGHKHAGGGKTIGQGELDGRTETVSQLLRRPNTPQIANVTSGPEQLTHKNPKGFHKTLFSSASSGPHERQKQRGGQMWLEANAKLVKALCAYCFFLYDNVIGVRRPRKSYSKESRRTSARRILS